MVEKNLIILSAYAPPKALILHFSGVFYLLTVYSQAQSSLNDYTLQVFFTEQTYQVLTRHLTDADHPDCVWRNRLVVEGCVHE